MKTEIGAYDAKTAIDRYLAFLASNPVKPPGKARVRRLIEEGRA